MSVIDLRGCSGSGKSWVMHSLISRYEGVEVKDHSGRPIGYRLVGCRRPAFVIGPYLGRICGGCDGIKDAEEINRCMRWGLDRGMFVLLEGLLVSHTYTRYSQIASETEDYRFLFLNTPLEVCYQRVAARRAARGKGPLGKKGMDRIRWDRNTTFGNPDCHYQKFLQDGHYARIIPWQSPLPVVLSELLVGKASQETIRWEPSAVGHREASYRR